MQWAQTEMARIENQFNQPLSISVIFSLLSFPSAASSSSSSSLPHGFEMCRTALGGGTSARGAPVAG